MGAVRLLHVPFLATVLLLPPHSRFVFWWETSIGLGCPHPSPVAGITQGERAPDWGVPPLLPLGQGPPPLPLLHAVHKVRTLMFGGGFPPSSVP